MGLGGLHEGVVVEAGAGGYIFLRDARRRRRPAGNAAPPVGDRGATLAGPRDRRRGRPRRRQEDPRIVPEPRRRPLPRVRPDAVRGGQVFGMLLEPFGAEELRPDRLIGLRDPTALLGSVIHHTDHGEGEEDRRDGGVPSSECGCCQIRRRAWRRPPGGGTLRSVAGPATPRSGDAGVAGPREVSSEGRDEEPLKRSPGARAAEAR